MQVVDLTLSASLANSSIHSGWVHAAARANGGLTLGWNHNGEAHLTRLNAQYEQEGADWILNDVMISDILELPDDGVVVMVTDYSDSMTNSFSPDRQLRLMRLDANGETTLVAPVVGGDGEGAGADWYAWSSQRGVDVMLKGDGYAVFTKISHNFGDGVGENANTHQGDLYVEMDASGALLESNRGWWGVSHSNRPHLLEGPSGESITLTVGDGSPYGVMCTNRTDGNRKEYRIWPPEDQVEVGDEESVSTVGAGDLCGFTRRGERLFATVGTVREQPFNYFQDSGEVLLLSWPVGSLDDTDVTTTWLTDSSEIPERCPTLSPMRDHQLSVWGRRTERNATEDAKATLALIDGDGKLVNGPTTTDAPFNENSMAVTLSDGSVAWTYAEPDESTVQLVIVKP